MRTLPEWMLDAGICATMTLGSPRVSTDALHDLHRLLQARGFRRSSDGDLPVTQEPHDVRMDPVSQAIVAVNPRAPAEDHGLRIGGLTAPERQKIIKQLAQILMLGLTSKIRTSTRAGHAPER